MFIFENLEWVLFMITGLLVFTTPWREDSSVSKSSLNCLFLSYIYIILELSILCAPCSSSLLQFCKLMFIRVCYNQIFFLYFWSTCVIVECFTKTRNCIRGIKTDIDSDFRFAFVVFDGTQMMLWVLFANFRFC